MVLLPLQRHPWEHLQLPRLREDIPGDAKVPPVFVDLPSQELALFGKAVLEDFDYTSLPRFQIHLCLDPDTPVLRYVHFIQVGRWGDEEIESHNGEML